MAPKKNKKSGLIERPNAKGKSSKSKTLSELDFNYSPTSNKITEEKEDREPVKLPAKSKSLNASEITQDEDLHLDQSITGFIMNQIENSINTRHVFQILLLLFMTNTMYVWFKNEQTIWIENGSTGTDPMEYLIIASCVFLICILEYVAIINSKFSNWHKKVKALNMNIEDPKIFKEKAIELKSQKPDLPYFNYIYATFVPLLLVLLLTPQYLIAIAICVVQNSEMHAFVRCLISYVVIFQFSGGIGDQTIGNVASNVAGNFTFGSYLKTPLICSFTHEAFNRLIGNTVSPVEKSILVTSSTFLLTLPSSQSANLTITIMQYLFLSMFIGTSASCGFYWLYKTQQDSSLRYLLNILIYVVFIAAFTIVSDKFLFPILGKLHINWLKEFLLTSEQRIEIFKYWVLVTIAIIPFTCFVFFKIVPSASIDIKRKVWHFFMFFMIIKPMLVDPELVSVALFGIAGILIVTELIRANNIPPFASKINKLFISFLDSKDAEGDWVTSYIYLVLGIGAPLWLNNVNPLKESTYLGLITLGLGDSIASLVGKRYGNFCWPNSKKTIEGSAAFAFGTACGLTFLHLLASTAGIDLEQLNIVNKICLVVLVSVFEGVVDVNDNLFVPLFALIAEEVLIRFN